MGTGLAGSVRAVPDQYWVNIRLKGIPWAFYKTKKS